MHYGNQIKVCAFSKSQFTPPHLLLDFGVYESDDLSDFQDHEQVYLEPEAWHSDVLSETNYDDLDYFLNDTSILSKELKLSNKESDISETLAALAGHLTMHAELGCRSCSAFLHVSDLEM